jgi:hypothetical protein
MMYDDLIQIAQSYLFIKESPGNRGRWVDLFNTTSKCPLGSSYCASFINHCLLENQERHGHKSDLNFSAHVMTLFRQNVAAYRQTPKLGHLITWNHVGTDTGHVGLIIEVVDGKTVKTIEANTSAGSNVEREGEGIYLKTRKLEPVGLMKPNPFFLDPYWRE